VDGPAGIRVLAEPPTRSDGSYPPVFRVLGSDGVYEVRTSPVGQFCARIEAGLELAEGFYPVLPPCPASLLGRIVEIFKERPKVEALVTLVYDTEEGEYRLVWQGNDADGHSVQYVPLIGDERHVVVGEIHSHHAMDPFFSRDDDESERRLGVYGVVGHIGRGRPTALFRFPCGTLPSGRTRFLPLRAEKLFSPAAEVWSIVEQPFVSARDRSSLEGLLLAAH
jgi:hypothetical protein